MPRAKPGLQRALRRAVGATLLFGAGLVSLRMMLPKALQDLPGGPDDLSGRTGRGHTATPPSPPARAAGHETQDMNARTMMRLLIGLGAAVTVMVAGMIGLRAVVTHNLLAGRPALTAEQTTRITPPAPNLQADPAQEIATLNTADDHLLDSYGWADADHTRARIPVQRAMTLVLGQSLEAAP